MKVVLALAALSTLLSGCIVAPAQPVAYGPGPEYYPAPGYYAAPAVSVGVGVSDYGGHGWHSR